MSNPSTPRPPAPRADEFSIEIDPSVIEEALAAVDRRLGPVPTEAGLEVEVEAEPPPRPTDDDERRRLLHRLAEQSDALRRSAAEHARVVEARDLAEKQLRDLRRLHGELTQDFERFRARTKKDLEEAERRGEERAIRPLVEVYDNVQRAWLHAVAEPSHVLGGLQMIVDQFGRLLLKLGFERIDAERGGVFDPNRHEAVMHVRTDELPPGAIVEEVQAGFRHRGRLFRPARVTVSAPPPAAPAD
jgi:molecular chaperone GrpE